MQEQNNNEKLKLTNDVAFQNVFGKVGNERITKRLLERILGIEIEGLTLDTNKRLYGDSIDDKIGRLDVKAVLSDGTKVIIEMQVASYKYMAKRQLYYWAKTYTEGLHRGDDYNGLNKTISILISVDGLTELEDVQKYHSKWKIREDRTGMILTEDLEIHVIELNKFDIEKNKTEEAEWINLIKGGEIRMSKETDKELQEAKEELERITQDPETRELYYQREKDLRDKISYGLAEREDGFAEGLAKGEEKLREKEAKMIKAMQEKGISIDIICEITNSKKEEVEKILKSK